MFKFFKKKNVEKIETIFPTAKEMLEATQEKWPTISDEEILRGIERKKDKGERYVYFFYSYISEQTQKELRQQGYCVWKFTDGGAPGFKISW